MSERKFHLKNIKLSNSKALSEIEFLDYFNFFFIHREAWSSSTHPRKHKHDWEPNIRLHSLCQKKHVTSHPNWVSIINHPDGCLSKVRIILWRSERVLFLSKLHCMLLKVGRSSAPGPHIVKIAELGCLYKGAIGWTI